MAETPVRTAPSPPQQAASPGATPNAGTAATASGCASGSVFFLMDSAMLDEPARSQLECLSRVSQRVSLVGMADPRGTDEYNLALGERRARSVAQYLNGLGLDGSRIDTRSVGEEFATGKSESDWARDRRVNFATQ